MRRIVIAIAALVVLIIGAVLIIPLFISTSAVRSQVLARLEQATGRQVRIDGPIAQIDGNTITVTNKGGKAITFAMTPNARIVSNVPIASTDIKSGDYIAIDTVKKNGKDVVIQAHIQQFAHGANAANERPMVTHKGAIRHLGQVASAMKVKGGVALTVTGTKGGEMDFMLTPNIVRYRNEVDGTSDLKPGVTLMTNANRNAEGKLTAGFLTIAKDGHKPIDIGY